MTYGSRLILDRIKTIKKGGNHLELTGLKYQTEQTNGKKNKLHQLVFSDGIRNLEMNSLHHLLLKN